MKPDLEGFAGGRIDETLLGPHPVRTRRGIERLALVAALAEQEPDQHDQRKDTEPDRKADHRAGSITAAVPYATISLMVLPISALSKRIMTIAFAPIAVAFCTMRSSAWRRASSSIWVYSWISPPTIERNPAMKLPPIPRLRTTTPKHCPSIRTVRYPVTFSVVTTITWALGLSCGLLNAVRGS